MPIYRAPPKEQIFPIYGAIDDQFGMDWLSRLGRFRQAETGAGFTNTPIYEPAPHLQPPMPNAYSVAPDSPAELRKKIQLFGGMFGSGL